MLKQAGNCPSGRLATVFFEKRPDVQQTVPNQGYPVRARLPGVPFRSGQRQLADEPFIPRKATRLGP